MISRAFNKIRLIIMLSPQKSALLLLITTATLSLIFQVASFLLAPANDLPVQCENDKAAILQQIAASRTCETDSDCILFKTQCPFNCNTIHKNHLATLTKQATAYKEQCGLCVNECEEAATPTCRNKLCSF